MYKINEFRKIFLISVLALLFSSTQLCAQEAGGADDPVFQDTMADMMIVAACGTTGAILGLSTLSFVDEPSEHLKNIVTGGAIGLIIGVGVVAWRQATKSKDVYWENARVVDPKIFNTAQRVAWHTNIRTDRLTEMGSISPNISYAISF